MIDAGELAVVGELADEFLLGVDLEDLGGGAEMAVAEPVTQPKGAWRGRPWASWVISLTHSPAKAVVMAKAVPSPPSAIGQRSKTAPGKTLPRLFLI
jgi:hypothetical protein